MTITEKTLAKELRDAVEGRTYNTETSTEEDWQYAARRAAELLGVNLPPEPKPLPTEPGSVIIATEVRRVKGEWRMFLDGNGDWVSSESISGYGLYHHPDLITAWTKAVVVPAGEKIDIKDVREGDRVRLVLDNGDDEVTFTVTRVYDSWIESHYDAYDFDSIRSVHLLHREEA